MCNPTINSKPGSFEPGEDGEFQCSFCNGWWDDVRVATRRECGEIVTLQVCQQCEDEIEKEFLVL